MTVPVAPFKPLLDTGGIVFPTVTGTLYAPPSGLNILARVTTMVFTSADAASRTFSLYRVPPSGTASQANILLAGQVLPAKTAWAWSPGNGIAVPQGWSLQGVVDSGTTLTFSADGYLYQ